MLQNIRRAIHRFEFTGIGAAAVARICRYTAIVNRVDINNQRDIRDGVVIVATAACRKQKCDTHQYHTIAGPQPDSTALHTALLAILLAIIRLPLPALMVYAGGSNFIRLKTRYKNGVKVATVSTGILRFCHRILGTPRHHRPTPNGLSTCVSSTTRPHLNNKDFLDAQNFNT
jgi:hypothetical protein